VIGRAILAVAVAAVVAGAAPAAAGIMPSVPGLVVDLPTRSGVTVRYAAFAPDQAPAAIAILFSGADGVINIPDTVKPDWPFGNFLVRIRENLRRRGFYVVVVDAPSDHKYGLGQYRLSEGHAEDIAAVIADVRRRAPGVPVWLIGTSMGSISAANGAARLHGVGAPDGLVLTSTVSRTDPSPRNAGLHLDIFDVDLSAVQVPTLVTYHRNDQCYSVGTGDGPRILARLEHAPRKEIMIFDGGLPPKSGPCDPFAAHGYFGIDDKVADAIADWILAAKH